MLPQGLKVVLETADEEMTSKTYKLDFNHMRISGTIDAQEAMLQAIHKIFATERFAYEIYTAGYGIELESLIGKPTSFVSTVLENRIREALTADTRILDITNFKVSVITKDTLEASGNIVTTQGTFGFREELNL